MADAAPRTSAASRGTALFLQAFFLLWSARRDLLRASIGSLALLVMVAVLGREMRQGLIEAARARGAEGVPPSVFIADALLFLAGVFAIAWLAVAWQRFVLLGERPRLIPPFRHVLGTLGQIVFIALVLFTVLLLPLMVSAFLLGGMGVAPNDPLALAISFVMNVLASWIVLLLSPMLTGAALGAPTGLFATFRATLPLSRPLLVTAALFTFFYMSLGAILGLLQTTIGEQGGLAGTLLGLAINWLVMVVGFSLMAAVYREVMQTRPGAKARGE